MSEEIIKIPQIITVGDLAKRLGVSAAQIVSELMKNGVMATINENIDYETAAIIAEYLGLTVEPEAVTVEQSASTSCKPKEVSKTSKTSEKRSPIIAVMGHVDHGKTSLLDVIRSTDVVKGEAGGITQHIGAYQVTKNDTRITFLDTPGHAAFEEMRAHGAQITDIALILIAADDGIKAQTLEAIAHAKKANTPMIVVITKTDKPGADIDRIYQQLAEIEMIPEAWGGKTVCVPVSAKAGDGIDNLLEMILLVSEMLDLKAEYSALASGVVVESHLDGGKGPVATILVINGTLRVGDTVQIGETYGKIRMMEDYKSRKVTEATPGMPVRIAGIKNVAQVAEPFMVFCEEKEAKEASIFYKQSKTAKRYSAVKKINLEAITESIISSERKELALVIKADVQGSLDAIVTALDKFSTAAVKVKIASAGVGDITESDIMMASTADKLIVAFGVAVPNALQSVAKNEGVKVSTYRVIYELLDDIKVALEALLPVLVIEITQGKLEVLQVFSTAKKLTIAGGKVIEGKIDKGAKAKIMRGEEEVCRFVVKSVHRGKDEVPSCQVGTECGLGLDGKVDVLPKDVIVTYISEEQKQTIDVKF